MQKFDELKDELLKQLGNLMEITEGHEITLDVHVPIARTVFRDAESYVKEHRAVKIEAHTDNGFTSYVIQTETDDSFGCGQAAKWSASELCYESIHNLVKCVQKHIIEHNLVAERERNYWLSVGIEQYKKTGHMYLSLQEDKKK